MAEKPAKVVPLFGRSKSLDDVPEVALQEISSTTPARPASKTPAKKAMDLSGSSKVVFLIGPGGTGKTMLARWLGWRATEAQRPVMMAALDPQNRSLASWMEDVHMPPTSDGTQTAAWLHELLGYVMESRTNAVLDFGGGDTALSRFVENVPESMDLLREAGVEPVAIYALAPRQDDLSVLEGLQRAGFSPRATALILNEGRVDSLFGTEDAFASVVRHSAFRAAVGRGAVTISMPRLEPEVAQEVEVKRLQFGLARDGKVPDGAKFPPIGGFNRSMVRRWLVRMDEAFEPISTWLP